MKKRPLHADSVRLTIHLSNAQFELLTIKGAGKSGDSWNERFRAVTDRLTFVCRQLACEHFATLPQAELEHLLSLELPPAQTPADSIQGHYRSLGHSLEPLEAIALAELSRYWQQSPESDQAKRKKIGI